MTTHYLLEEPNPQKKTSSKKAAIQRWCIIRSYGADPENPHLIIEVADASKALKPKILYPYHFGQTETSQLIEYEI